MKQLDEYNTFNYLGKKYLSTVEYKKIQVHLVYYVNYDGCHKTRFVAVGHLTDIPVESVYSGVASLHGICLLVFLVDLSLKKTWPTDIGIPYLEAKILEKVYIIAWTEFGNREVHFLIVARAFYGLQSAGVCCHERFDGCIRDMVFSICKLETGIWILHNGYIYI